MFCGDQTRMNDYSAVNNFVVMVAFAKVGPSHFRRIHTPAAARTVLRQMPFEDYLPPHQAFRLDVAEGRRAVIQQQDGGVAFAKVFLQGQSWRR